MDTAAAVFLATILATYAAAWYGRKHGASLEGRPLSEQKLNKFLVGLSAGATANSGFIVTGAVGLGYLYGYQWLLLPLGWLLGDIVFWTFFPDKLNRFGAKSQATTMAQLIGHGLTGPIARVLPYLIGTVVLLCLAGYTTAQWLAGQKFLEGAFELSPILSTIAFALIIVTYSAIGGFRGSIYADSLQAVIRVLGTLVALAGIVWVVYADLETYTANIAQAGPEFVHPLGVMSGLGALGFVVGYAFASLGFGLGQPQIVARYLAGRSPQETKAAWAVYIAFVQGTWISMTLFGMMLRGVAPDLADPETGFAYFFSNFMPPVVAGLILADIFATIGATTNSLLVSMSQTVVQDFFGRSKIRPTLLAPLSLVIVGLATMILSLSVPGSVVSFALISVSLMAAALAPAVMAKVLHLGHDGLSIALAITLGFVGAIVWRLIGYGAIVNEAFAGIVIGALTNHVVFRLKLPRRQSI